MSTELEALRQMVDATLAAIDALPTQDRDSDGVMETTSRWPGLSSDEFPGDYMQTWRLAEALAPLREFLRAQT